MLRNSDRIEFGVRDSYQLTFSAEKQDFQRLLGQWGATQPAAGEAGGASDLVKLRSLVEVARALQNSLSTQEVLTAVVDAALAVTRCERGFLLLRPGGDKNADLEVSVARDNAGGELQPDELRVPRHLIRRAGFAPGSALDVLRSLGRAGSASRYDSGATGASQRGVSAAHSAAQRRPDDTRTVSAMEDTVGLIYMDSRVTPADLSSGNRELLQTLAVEASTILENARLIEEERGKIRMEDELKLAREIQQGLQPSSMPQSGWFRAAGSSSPSTQVGGDYFDVRQNSPASWTAVVADVSGKGVGSALLASLLQGTFLMASGDPAHIAPRMARLNRVPVGAHARRKVRDGVLLHCGCVGTAQL